MRITHIPLPARITLQYWKQIIGEKYAQSGCTHVSIPLNFVSLHIPDIQLAQWREKGICHLEYLYDGTSILSFSALRVKYGLSPTDLYQYKRIVHLLKSLLSKQRAIPCDVPVSCSAASPN